MKLLFADKPAGATTHTSHGQQGSPDFGVLRELNDGFCEHLSARFGQELLVAHRLDRETTGCIAFARSREDAEQLREAFSSRRIKKRYLFLSPGKAPRDSLEIESVIERRGATYHSEPSGRGQPPNARTRLNKIAESDGVALWEALPETGKPHQIRLHAASAGIAILGDREHGGAPYPALCLHSERLTIPGLEGDLEASSPAPRWFDKRVLTRDPLLARWLAGIDRRERLLRSWSSLGDTVALDTMTLRWLHREGDPLRVEQLGSTFWMSWFRERPPSADESRALERLREELGWNDCVLQIRHDRGSGRASSGTPSQAKAPWTATENGLSFEFRGDQGLSPGLFLDQRQNRAWVQKNVNEKTVLNLFCYTGGFSVAAAAGKARKVVSVDLSRTFLDWAKKNFELNQLAVDQHEFRAIDSRDYLAWAKKKALSFDLVICDPPSFSRSEKGVFKIERDLEDLVQALIDVTAPGGRILFCSNFESWEPQELEHRLRSLIARGANAQRRLSVARTPSPDWDFELPNEPRNMKSLFIEVPSQAN